MSIAIAFFGESYLDHGKLNYVGNTNIRGKVVFSEDNSEINVDILLYGVPLGKHGFHIHEKGLTKKTLNLKGNCCDTLGGHYNGNIPIFNLDNPGGTRHGNHIGDLCFNINSIPFDIADTIVKYNYNDKKIKNINDIIGRSLVIHEYPDDKGRGNNIESLITGNAGNRISCANIYKM